MDRAIIQTISLIIFILIGALLFRMRKSNEEYVFPAFIYCLHVIIFYAFILTTRVGLHSLPDLSMNVWSGALRLHAGLTMLLMLITYMAANHDNY